MKRAVGIYLSQCWSSVGAHILHMFYLILIEGQNRLFSVLLAIKGSYCNTILALNDTQSRCFNRCQKNDLIPMLYFPCSVCCATRREEQYFLCVVQPV